MTLWLLSAYATNSDVTFSDQVRLCVRRDVAPTPDEAEALLQPLAQASVRGGRDGQDWPMDLSEVAVAEQPQIGIAGADPVLSSRLALHLADLEPWLLAGDDPALLAGVEVLFLGPVPRADGLLESAVAAGVRHVVLLSSADAADDAVSVRGRDSYRTEQALRQCGTTSTVLRLNLTADELLALADADGVIRGAAGDGRIAALSGFDVARISTIILNRPGDHVGETYSLTGPEPLTLTEITARLTVVLGRSLRHLDAPSTTQADLFAAIAAGAFAQTSIDIELLGRWEAHEIERSFDVF